MEVDDGFNIRAPVALLRPLASQQPRGQSQASEVSDCVSGQPTCPAAASHVAASSIYPYSAPWPTQVPEVTMTYTVVPVGAEAAVVAASSAAEAVVAMPAEAVVAASPAAEAVAVHWLAPASQKSPVEDVHAAVPQTQGDGLALAPFS